MSKQSAAIQALFERTGAFLRGHFRLTSGLHSPEYLQCALVLSHPEYAERLGKEIAAGLRRLAGKSRIDLVVSPALGGVVIGHETARALGVRFLFTERDGATGRMVLRRGFKMEPGQTAVIVEDVITTGGSSREVFELLRDERVEVAGAGSIIDRSGGQASIGAPHVSLATLDVVTYAPEICPLCKQGIPVTKPGSRPVAASV
ncbi:MAG TPA: orotate phosphoribosyltransferase [Solibacterales bacterium]|nr:orotate phosphoribosyltransferase [Bryobacterales bacterium]